MHVCAVTPLRAREDRASWWLSSDWRPACASSWGGRPRRAVWRRRRGTCGAGSALSSRIRSAVPEVVLAACSPVAPARAARGAPMPRSRWRGTRTGTTRPAAQPSGTAGRRSRPRAAARRRLGRPATDLLWARRLAVRGRRASRRWSGPRPRAGLPGSAKAHAEVRATRPRRAT